MADELLDSEPMLTPTEARVLTDEIKYDAKALWDKVTKAYLGRADVALGYESWDSYCSAEFQALRLRMPREERTDLVNSLRHAGLSNRAIGSAIGASEGTVRNDLAAQNYAPDAGEPDDERPRHGYPAFSPNTAREPVSITLTRRERTVEPVSIRLTRREPAVDSIRLVTGRDGKKYPAKPDVPQPTQSEKVQREARKVAADMEALTTRLLQLWTSDRALDESQIPDSLQSAWTDLEDAWNLRWRSSYSGLTGLSLSRYPLIIDTAAISSGSSTGGFSSIPQRRFSAGEISIAFKPCCTVAQAFPAIGLPLTNSVLAFHSSSRSRAQSASL